MNEKELIKWAKSHIDDLSLDYDRLMYLDMPNKRVFTVNFRNKQRMLVHEDKLGIKYVSVILPREGLRNVWEDLKRLFDDGDENA